MFRVIGDEVQFQFGNHTYRLVGRQDGGFDLLGNDRSVAEFKAGGGQLEVWLSGSLPTENNPPVGFPVDPDGYIHIEKS
jgi:hypothetical protein